MKIKIVGLCLILLSASCFAQQSTIYSRFALSQKHQYSDFTLTNYRGYESSQTVFKPDFKKSGLDAEFALAASMPNSEINGIDGRNNILISKNDYSLIKNENSIKINSIPKSDDFFEKNRRIIYSSLELL